MKGRRVFDRFGFDLPPKDEVEYNSPQLLSTYKKWEFNPALSDWENVNSTEKLTDYKLPSHLKAMLQNNINTVAQ